MSGEVVRRYNSSKRVRLNPERWMPVLRHVRPSDISTLQLLGNPVKNDSMRIVEAIVAEIHRNLPQTSADDAAGVPHSVIAAVHVANIDAVRRAEGAALAFSDIDGDKLHVAQMSAHIEPYLDALIADATLSHLLALLPETLLVRMFSRYMVKALGGNSPLSHEALHAVFLDNEHLSAQLRQQMLTDYVYLMSFPERATSARRWRSSRRPRASTSCSPPSATCTASRLLQPSTSSPRSSRPAANLYSRNRC